ncbi:MAG TPA: diaminopimelate epimerase [Stellaceae bacterium]|nr:diaminopimelate epimerase [Stellaceae bacterium]
MTRIQFHKMHGLGNDFVVLDQRADPVRIGAASARALADRRTGIGCDQLLLLEPPHDPRAQVFLRILNPDGSEAEACGNGTRCVAALLAAETGAARLRIETMAGLLDAEILGDGRVTIDMGEAKIGWREIPLAREMDTLRVDLTLGRLSEPVCTSMGNPHATFFVADVEGMDADELRRLGRTLEHDELFPERANIGIATVRGDGAIRLRVWERGAGLTLACGSGACAALVGACRRGLIGRRATVVVDGGCLDIEWRQNGHVMMTGPVAEPFDGSFDAALLGGR